MSCMGCAARLRKQRMSELLYKNAQDLSRTQNTIYGD